MDKLSIEKAKELSESDSWRELYEFLKPYLEIDDPHAHSFLSMFSLPEWKLSEEEMNEKYTRSVLIAAEGGVAGSMYRAAQLYFVGDGVERDVSRGKAYLDAAMAKGYGIAKYSIAINTFYGANGYTENQKLSFELLEEAILEKVEDAEEALEKLKMISKNDESQISSNHQ